MDRILRRRLLARRREPHFIRGNMSVQKLVAAGVPQHVAAEADRAGMTLQDVERLIREALDRGKSIHWDVLPRLIADVAAKNWLAIILDVQALLAP